MAKTETQPKILLVYASNSGNTRLVAERIADRLNTHGLPTIVRDVTGLKPHELRGNDVIVFGSCTWNRRMPEGELEAQLPEHMHRFVESADHVKLPKTRFAVFALGRHEYTGFAGAANHLQVFVNKLGGELLLSPLRMDGFPHHQLETVDAWADQLVGTIRSAQTTLAR